MVLNYSACFRSIFKLLVFLIFKAHAAGIRKGRTEPDLLSRKLRLCGSTEKGPIRDLIKTLHKLKTLCDPQAWHGAIVYWFIAEALCLLF